MDAMGCVVAMLYQLWPWHEEQVQELHKPYICWPALQWRCVRDWKLQRQADIYPKIHALDSHFLRGWVAAHEVFFTKLSLLAGTLLHWS